MVNNIIDWIVACLELGIEFVMTHLITVEGIIALLLGMFFVGLISSLKG